jgi:hypothetical protein
MVAEILLGGVAEAVIGYLVAEGAPSIKKRLGLARDPIKVAFDTCLHRAVIATFSQHSDRKVSLFNAAFLKTAAPLLARTLTPDDTLTARDLAEAWAQRETDLAPHELAREIERIFLVCETFLTHMRTEMRLHPTLLAVTQAKDTAAIRRELEQANVTLPSLLQTQKEVVQTLEAILGELLSLPERLSQLRKDLLQGMNRLPTDYSSRVNNFLREYLGDEVNLKVPFGGRDHDVNSLTHWLETPDAPRCLFLSAEAGRGKSALLVRWCVALQEFSDVKVVFVPISIRFETSAKEVFYAALAAKLAPIYDEAVNYQTLSADQWKGVCDSYLQTTPPHGQRILIVIDGFDEATGWQPATSFVPLPVPQNIYIVASARTQARKTSNDWLRQLGWHHVGSARVITLRPLDQSGVEAVLVGMGNPLDQLSMRGDILSKLMVLTEGDPLLIRLYVEALVGIGENAPFIGTEQLIGMEKEGLQGYFYQWWEDQLHQWEKAGRNPIQVQKEVEAFFFAVASSFGPISKEDVLAVTKPEELNGFRLNGIAKEVGRFVIGNGEERGYTFSHPRLGYYFFEQLGKNEQTEWNDRYVQYGGLTVQSLKERGRTEWDYWEIHTYAYVVQHYVTHLDRAKAALEAYYALICHEWAQAWEVLRGTYDGFLGDVMHVWYQAQDDPDVVRGMTMQVWCALCQSSVVGLSTNLPPSLIVGALQSGVLSKPQVAVLIRQNSNERRKQETITGVLTNTTGIAEDKSFLQHLLEVAHTLRDDGTRAEVLGALAPYLPSEVLESVHTLRDDGTRAEVLGALAPYLPSEVLESAHALQHAGACAEVLCTLAPHLPDPPTIYREALEVARTLQHAGACVEVLCALAPHLPGKVLEVARSLRDDGVRARVLCALAPHLPDPPSIYREALEVAHTLQDDMFGANTRVLIALAPHLPGEVLQVTLTLRDSGFRAKVLSALAPHLPSKVLEVARTLKDDMFGTPTEVLCALAPHLPSEVLEVAYTLQAIGTRAEVLSALAPHLPNEVLELARTLQHANARAKVLSASAPHLPDPPSIYREALEVARTLQDAGERVEVLTALALHLPDSPSIYHETLKVVRTVQDDGTRVVFLSALVAWVPDSPSIYREALEVARTLRDYGKRVEFLSALAPHLPDPPSIYHEALEVARTLRDYGKRVEFLSALAPHLPIEVLKVASTLQDVGTRAKVLSTLAPHLPGKVLEVARTLQHAGARAKVLSALAPHLPSEVLELARTLKEDVFGTRAEVLCALASHLPGEVLELARILKNAGARAKVLSALAPHLPDSPNIYREALEVARTLQDDGTRVMVLSALAPHLPDPPSIYREALKVARTLKDVGTRAEVLTALAPHLPDPPSIYHEALEVARTLKNDVFGARRKILSALAPHLPVEVLGVARTLQDDVYGDREKVLSALAPHLPSEVLEVTLTLQNDRVRAEVLSTLAPHLPVEVLEVACALQDGIFGSRARVLTALAPHLPSEVLEVAHTLQHNVFRSRAKVLRELAIPLIRSAKSKDIWNQTMALSATRPRSDLLSDLAALMPFTLSLANTLPHSSSVHTSSITLIPAQFTYLLNLLQSLTLSTTAQRMHFLDTLGIPLSLRNTLHFDVPQNTFTYNLLNALIHFGTTPDGTSYFAIFLRYLHDVEWAGHPERRTFVAELLSTAPVLSPHQRLAQGILEAVQTVCSWWP